jgi:hypothetical protein
MSWFLNPSLLKLVYTGFSNEHPGEKKLRIRDRIINGKQAKLLFHNGWWHGNTSSFITLQKRSNNNSIV